MSFKKWRNYKLKNEIKKFKDENKQLKNEINDIKDKEAHSWMEILE